MSESIRTPTSVGASPMPSPPPASAGAGLSGAPASRPGCGNGPLRNGNPRDDPNSAPRCGARTRSGCPCRAPVMASGRYPAGRARGQVPHGGRCTGPRTAEGMARMIAARTTLGMYAAAGAPQRAEQRYVRTLIVRTRLLCAATPIAGVSAARDGGAIGGGAAGVGGADASVAGGVCEAARSNPTRSLPPGV